MTVPGSPRGHENPPRAKFCLECGTALTVECLHCHADTRDLQDTKALLDELA